jgi:hypothetical protein
MKKDIQNYIRTQLGTNPAWAVKALVKVYTLQTLDEQATGQTSNLNGVGFSGIDSKILYKKMPRYHKQVASFIPAEKMVEIEKNLAVN